MRFWSFHAAAILVIFVSRFSKNIGLLLYPTDWLKFCVMNWHFSGPPPPPCKSLESWKLFWKFSQFLDFQVTMCVQSEGWKFLGLGTI